MTIKPIETIYNNYRFRSRLEARWAVFFDALGIEYIYEKEGYDLGGGIRYLPDFWLPEHKYWIEIKGQEPTEEENMKCWRLTRLGNAQVFLFAGNIPEPGKEGACAAYSYSGYEVEGTRKTINGLTTVRENTFKEKEFGWTECPFCGRFYIARFGSIRYPPSLDNCSLKSYCRCESMYIRIDAIEDILCEQIVRLNRENSYYDEYWGRKCRAFLSFWDSPCLVAAYTAARQARFEYGEKG